MARNFAQYISLVAFRGERFVLMRGKKAIGGLRPVPSGKRLGVLPELLASLPKLGTDEAERLAADLDGMRAELQDRELHGP